MLKKTILSPLQAAEKLRSGMTIMVGGFMTIGTPEDLIDAILETGVSDLTIICNDAGLPDKGVGKLIRENRVSRLIASHIGLNRTAGDRMNQGEMTVDLIPQGTLAEQIRCGGAGIGGFLTQTGTGTLVQDNKQLITVNNQDYLLELPLKADAALIKARCCDIYGNTNYNKTARNFNPLMALAADLVLVEPDTIDRENPLCAENVVTPAVLVDYLVEKAS